MNQYIITEELLVKLQRDLRNQDLVKFFEGINEVFSNPYNPQAERETVLDDITQFIQKHHWKSQFGEVVTFYVLCRFLKELRQEGKVEK